MPDKHARIYVRFYDRSSAKRLCYETERLGDRDVVFQTSNDSHAAPSAASNSA